MFRLTLIRICCFYLTIALVANVSGQSFLTSSRHLTVEDGLSGRFVRDVQEDHLGFIWINTWRGLNRYDGFSFVPYSRSDYGFHLEDYDQLELDANGRLWMIKLSQTEEGRAETLDQFIDVFDPVTEKLLTEQIFQVAPFQLSQIKAVTSDLDGKIWFQLVTGELYTYDGIRYRRLQLQTDQAFFPLSDGSLVIIDQQKNQLIRYDPLEGFIAKWSLPPGFLLAAADRQGGFLVGTNNKENDRTGIEWQYYDAANVQQDIFFRVGGQPVCFNPTNPEFTYNLVQDGFARWWVSDGESIFVFDEQFRQIALFPLETQEKKYLYKFHVDQYNSVWGSSAAGIFAFGVRKNLFQPFLVRSNLIDTRGVAELQIGQIAVNQGTTYFLDPTDRRALDSLELADLRGLYQDTAGGLWIGRYHAGVYRYNITRDQIDTLNFKGVELENRDDVATNIFHRASFNDTLFVGTLGRGLYFFDKQGQEFRPYPLRKDFTEFSTADIHCFYENQRGLWIGTDRGLYLLEKNKGITRRWPLATELVQQQVIYAIHEDDKGEFWLGTLNHGLIRWQPGGEILDFYTTENGLSDNTVYAVYDDGFGYFWLPGNLGLMRMNKQTKTVYTYQEEDGIPHKEFNATAHLRTKDGLLIFGGLQGLVALDPKDFHSKKQKDQFSLRISALQITGDTTLRLTRGELNQEQELTLQLAKEQAAVQIELAAFNKLYRDKSQYAWRVDGSIDWHDLKGNIMSINRITYGENRFWIRGRTPDGNWLDTPFRLTIYRQYPFYLRAYFLVPLLLGLFILIYLAFKNNRSRRTVVQTPKIGEGPKASVTSDRRTTDPNQGISEQVEHETLPSAIEQWVAELNEKAHILVEENKFSTLDLASAMNMSDRQLRRKMKQHNFASPGNFMREIRLQKAKRLLQSQTFDTVAEVCYAVGFSTPKHFSRLFQQRFGRRPSSFLESVSEEE